MIRRKLHAVHQQLALVERTEIGRKRIAKVDGAEQFIVDGIGDGQSVRALIYLHHPGAFRCISGSLSG